MTAEDSKPVSSLLGRLLLALLTGPGLELVADLWKLGKKLWQGFTEEGMYEVLEYESTLELQDSRES